MTQTAQRYEQSIQKAIGLDYLLGLPADYDKEAGKQWPLILFLHGAGERGSLELVKKYGIARHMEDEQALPFITISPCCPVNEDWEGYHQELMLLLESVISAYRVDEKRVYLTGLSMGGYGSWKLAWLYPERFAAVVPICGGMPWYIDKQQAADTLRHLPIWVFHGAKDPVVPVEESRSMVKALMEAGGKVSYTEYPDLMHDSWTITYENPELYDWFIKQEMTDGE